MLSDPDRGWAWTNALFGIPAKTVIVCGSDDALSHVRRAAEAANESLDVVTFERKTPLVALDAPVPLEDVQPGDAVVAFSRRVVHEIREALVVAGRSVATIYGALSPEVRRAEARRFRDGEAEVLVTTDAIGMGLNLGPLKRVIFSSVTKWDGTRHARSPTRKSDRSLDGPGASAIRTRAMSRQRTRRASGRSAMPSPGSDGARRRHPVLCQAGSDRDRGGGSGARHRIACRRAGALLTRDLLRRLALPALGDGGSVGGRSRGRQGGAADPGDFRLRGRPDRRRDAASKAVLDRWVQARAAGTFVPALRASVDGELDDLERTVKLAAAYLWLARRFPTRSMRRRRPRLCAAAPTRPSRRNCVKRRRIGSPCGLVREDGLPKPRRVEDGPRRRCRPITDAFSWTRLRGTLGRCEMQTVAASGLDRSAGGCGRSARSPPSILISVPVM